MDSLKKTTRGGVRPNSGRKGYADEIMVKKIMVAANNIILNTLEGKGKYANVSDVVVLDIASKFALKGVPQQFEGDLLPNQNIIVVRFDGNQAKELPRRVHIHRGTVPGNGVSLGNGQESLPYPSGS